MGWKLPANFIHQLNHPSKKGRFQYCSPSKVYIHTTLILLTTCNNDQTFGTLFSYNSSELFYMLALNCQHINVITIPPPLPYKIID